MNSLVTDSDIRELAKESGLCVSIYIPTSPTGRERMEAPVRFKNQIEKAHRLLVESGMRSTIAWNLLEPAQEIAQSEGFWTRAQLGLAMFLTEGTFRHFRTPFNVQELTVVGPRFHIRPLLALAKEESCHILALDEKRARLLRVQGEAVEEVDVPGMPTSLDVALGPEYSEKQRQMHPTGRAPNLHGASHGAGDRAADAKNRDLRYCQAIDRVLTKFLAHRPEPLFVAAAEPLRGIYAGASHYAHLSTESIAGFPGRTSDEDLAEAARTILQKERTSRTHAALERCSEREHAGKALRGVEKLIPEAISGKVETLFIDDGVLRWGFVDAAGHPQSIEEQEPWAEELLNRAAIETIARGGSVVEMHDEPFLREAVAIGSLRF
jgi:hypothetical protein